MSELILTLANISKIEKAVIDKFNTAQKMDSRTHYNALSDFVTYERSLDDTPENKSRVKTFKGFLFTETGYSQSTFKRWLTVAREIDKATFAPSFAPPKGKAPLAGQIAIETAQAVSAAKANHVRYGSLFQAFTEMGVKTAEADTITGYAINPLTLETRIELALLGADDGEQANKDFEGLQGPLGDVDWGKVSYSDIVTLSRWADGVKLAEVETDDETGDGDGDDETGPETNPDPADVAGETDPAIGNLSDRLDIMETGFEQALGLLQGAGMVPSDIENIDQWNAWYSGETEKQADMIAADKARSDAGNAVEIETIAA
jgi:hypothetical protein